MHTLSSVEEKEFHVQEFLFFMLSYFITELSTINVKELLFETGVDISNNFVLVATGLIVYMKVID
jgi:hypothetical protein